MDKKDHFVSLRTDMHHVAWKGIRLRPDVDIQFRLEPFADGCRLIRLRLCRNEHSVPFVTGASFSMSDLGKDHERLETISADLTVIARCVSQISANMESDGGVLLRVIIMEDEQLFRLYAKESGSLQIDRWDWFLDPAVVVGDGTPMHVSRPIGELHRLAAA